MTRRCVDQLLNETSAGFATELSKFLNQRFHFSIPSKTNGTCV